MLMNTWLSDRIRIKPPVGENGKYLVTSDTGEGIALSREEIERIIEYVREKDNQ